VVVLVTGRPLVLTDLLPGWRALVVAWLPGSEGAGVADVLFGDAAPSGKLPVTWPSSGAQLTVHSNAPANAVLFPLGFGLGYTAPAP
jgi:beta-glucosidase